MQLGTDGTLAEIGACACAPKSSVHHVLAGLVRRGYVTARDHAHCGPAPKIFVLAGMADVIRDYALMARGALDDLRRHTSDTIHVALLVRDAAVYVKKRDSSRPYRSVSKVGLPLQLHSTAMGKAILAALPEADRGELTERLPVEALTPRRLTAVAALRKEVAAVEACRFAIDDEENEELIRCVGAGFKDDNSPVLGAVSVSAPRFLMRWEQGVSLGPHVLRAADELSAALGGPLPRGRLVGPGGWVAAQ